ncbi:hypothetical protein TNCV_1562831 [Trichonephila clavipes]|nr:hypothetical protein TNCV_1562831 [Trichonephila clavipes]
MGVPVFSFGEASCLVVVQTFTSSTQVQSTGPIIVTACTLPPVTIWELRLALQDEWAAMPQQLIDTLILSMSRRCETCLAVRGDQIPY